MSSTRNDVEQALHILDDLRLSESDDVELQTSLGDVLHVLTSPLFGALLDVHAAYHTMTGGRMPRTASSTGSLSSLRSSRNTNHSFANADLITMNLHTASSSAPSVHHKITPKLSELIVLPIAAERLGFTITGGIDKPNYNGDTNVYVFNMEQGSPIETDGRLHIGDQIMTANGWAVQGLTQTDVIEKLLKPSAAGVMELRVVHADPNDIFTYEVTLNKGTSGLGINIAGGRDQPYIPNSPGIFVTKIILEGAAQRDGRLGIGDQIISVNGNPVEAVDHSVAVQFLKQSGDTVKLIIAKNALAIIKRRTQEREAGSLMGSTNSVDKTPPQPTATSQAQIKIQNPPSPKLGPSPSLPARPSIPMFITTRAVSLEDIPVTGTPEGYGFSLVDGPSGVYIDRISPSGLVAQHGDVQEGNRVVSINGKTKLSLPEAMAMLKELHATATPLLLEVTDPQPDEETGIKRAPSMPSRGVTFGGVQESRLTSSPSPSPSPAVGPPLVLASPPAPVPAPPPPVSSSQPLTLPSSLPVLTATQLEEIAHSQPSSAGFYVRTLFEFKVLPAGSDQPPGKLLFFRALDILFVSDSSKEDWWIARSLDNSSLGFIPSALRLERNVRRSQLEEVQSNSSRKKTFSITKRLWRRKSKDDVAIEVGPAPSVPSYEVVALKPQTPGYARPLMILGPSKDFVVDHLFAQYPERFATAVPHTTRPQRRKEINGEDYHFVSVEEMEAEIQKGGFIEAGKYNGQLYGTSVRAIRSLADKGKHVIVDVSAGAIHRMLSAELAPVVVFLHADSVATVRKQNPTFDEAASAQVHDLALKVEAEFTPMFTAIINNVKLDDTFARVLTLFEKEVRMPYWTRANTPLPGFLTC